MSAPLRLGFPVKVLGRPDLKSNDTRRWQNGPHLKTSLEYLDQIFDYLHARDIRMYRMASDLAPYATHPGMPQFHNQVAEAASELATIGAKARDLDLRLSFHPSQYVLLNSLDPALTERSIADFAVQAEILDAMGCGPEAVVITHVGGVYGDHDASRARWVAGWQQCPEVVRRRLVLENDDVRFSAADCLWLHEQTGVRLVFDHQHHWCLNPEGLSVREALEGFLKTWPQGVRPKIHFSSPRTEFREFAGKGKKAKPVLRPPVWTGHADFAHPFEAIRFLRDTADLEYDVMLESKAKDVALLRLRADLLRYAPDQAARFGLSLSELAEDEEELDELALAAE